MKSLSRISVLHYSIRNTSDFDNAWGPTYKQLMIFKEIRAIDAKFGNDLSKITCLSHLAHFRRSRCGKLEVMLYVRTTARPILEKMLQAAVTNSYPVS